MRKWTYLVAALLMGGVTTSLTSCIDNEEPAGITDLRGAKAELLRAKAAVEQAEAAIKTAQVKWYEAEAEIKNQEAEQAKLETAWLEAKYQAQKDSLEIETQKYVERQKKLLIEAQQATAEANAAYQKALADLEASLVGIKESAYAERLMELMNSEIFTYDYISIVDGKEQTETISVSGLKGIINALESAQNDLAEYRRVESEMKFSFSKDAKLAAVQSQINLEKGKLEGLKENLEDLKTIKGVAFSDWQKQYEEFEKKFEELGDQYSQTEVKQKEALQVVEGRKDSLTNANSIEKVFAFSVPDEIAADIYEEDWKVGSDKEDKNKNVNLWAFEGSDVGEYTFPNKVELKLNLSDKKDLLVGNEDKGGIVAYLENQVLSDAELSAAQATVATNKAVADQYIKADGTGVYDKAVKDWEEAMKAFHDQFNLLTDPADVKLDGIKQAKEVYDEKITAAAGDAAKIKAAKDEFAPLLNEYVSERSKLDGWYPNANEEFDATKDADFNTWLTLTSDDEKYGPEVSATMTPNDGGLWKAYDEAAEKIGYTAVVNPVADEDVTPDAMTYVEYTYEKFKLDADAANASTGDWMYLAGSLGGYTKVAFIAKYTAETVQKQIDTQDAWKALQKEILALYDAYKADQINSDKVEGEILAQENVIKGEWSEKLNALKQQQAGLNAIMLQITNVLNSATGDSKKTYEKAVEWIEQQIAYLEGGYVNDANSSIVTGGIDYEFIVTSDDEDNEWTGIPAQEAKVKEFESLKAAIESGDYKLEEETAMENIAVRIKTQEDIVKGLEAILASANKVKDQLIAGMTGESSSTTPDVPETPAE